MFHRPVIKEGCLKWRKLKGVRRKWRIKMMMMRRRWRRKNYEQEEEREDKG